MHNITVLDTSKEGTIQVLQADEGKTSPEGWQFEKGAVYTVGDDGDILNTTLFEKSVVKFGLDMSKELNKNVAKEMNFSKLDAKDENLTSALGGLTNGVSPIEMTAAYATLENEGKYREPTCIVKITDADGVTLYENQMEEKQVYKVNASRMMTDMLVSVMQEGTGKGLALDNMPCAGKTGTTNDNKDGWFAGYTSYYTTCVWVGYDMPKELPGLSGASYPGAIWKTFMEQIHQGLAPVNFNPYIDENKQNLNNQEYLDGVQEEEGEEDTP